MMIPLRKSFENERKRLNVPWIVLEQDYLLSWVLWGIQSISELKNSLVFKGGTALKKAYFGEYRFSEDLDFTLIPEGKDINLEEAMKLGCQNAQKSMNEFIPNPVIICAPYTEKNPHPEGQVAFTIKGQLPWHRDPQVRVMVEITKNELLVMEPVERAIQHSYDTPLPFSLLAYPLEEIMAEKLRAILQNIQKYHERGWGRSRARDYYDLWCILEKYAPDLNLEALPSVLKKKCAFKGIPYPHTKEFFDLIILDKVKIEWEQWLAPLVPSLPHYDTVLPDLEKSLKAILEKGT